MTRSVVGVLVRVPGTAIFAVALGPPSIKLGTYKIGTISVPITDTGGLLGKPTLNVKVTKGAYAKSVTHALDTLLPGDSNDGLHLLAGQALGTLRAQSVRVGRRARRSGLQVGECRRPWIGEDADQQLRPLPGASDDRAFAALLLLEPHDPHCPRGGTRCHCPHWGRHLARRTSRSQEAGERVLP